MEDKIKQMDRMASLEEKHAISLESESLGLGDDAINGLVASIAHDSKKHAGLYRTISTLLERGSLAIPEFQADEYLSSLEKHIEVEKKMLDGVQAMLEGEKDERVRFLLSEILSDEVRHHRRDTIPEEDIWNMLWRDVESHGAPPDPNV
jgi:hypothetical protein